MSRPAHVLRVISLATIALLLPFAVVLAFFTTDVVFSYAVNVYLFDIPLALLILGTIPELARQVRTRIIGLGAGLWAALALLVALSFALHPSLEGVQTLFRDVGTLSIAVAFAGFQRHERGLVIGALALGALTQTAWAVAQVVNGAPLGAWWLFESQKPLAKFGNAWFPKGTMQTPYLLTALALVSSLVVAHHALGARALAAEASPATEASRTRRAISSGAAIVALMVTVGITYSRAGLVGLLGAIAVLLPRARADLLRRVVIAALAIGFALPAVLTSSGWLARGEHTLGAGADTGRRLLLLQGIAVFSMAPLTGVGPGRYMATLGAFTDDPAITRLLLPTHLVPLLVAAESGVLAGATVIVLLGALFIRAARDRDDAAIALYAVLIPFWLLDVLPYTLPQGIILTGVWLGALDISHRDRVGAGSSKDGRP